MGRLKQSMGLLVGEVRKVAAEDDREPEAFADLPEAYFAVIVNFPGFIF